MSNRYSSIEEIKEKYKKELEEWWKDDRDKYFNTDDDEKLLLCIVAYEGDFAAVKFLVGVAEVEPNDDYYYRTPLQYAVRNGNFKIVKYLVEKCDGDAGEVITLISARQPKIAKYLIDHGADDAIPGKLQDFLDAFDIGDQVNKYIMKLLKKVIDKKLAEKKEEEDDIESYDYILEFYEEKTAKKMYKQLAPIFTINKIKDTRIEIWDAEIEDAKFQEIADKFKAEFTVYCGTSEKDFEHVEAD